MIGNAEDLDIVMSINNLSVYIGGFSMRSGKLWNYYKDEVNDDVNERKWGWQLRPRTWTTAEIFQITTFKFYALIVALTINDNIKFLESIKQGFKRKITCSKYRSELTTQPSNSNWIIWLIQHWGISIECLFFYSKIVRIILQDVLLINFTCRW